LGSPRAIRFVAITCCLALIDGNVVPAF